MRSLQIRKIVEINSDSIDEVLRTAVKERIPAVSAAVVAHDKNIYEGHFGYSDLSKNSLVDEKSLFRIASMTKAITSACIFQLIDKNLLNLDTQLKEYFPEIADRKVIEGFDENGEAILKDVTNDITIGHLITHTSGFAYEIWNANIAKLVEKGDLVSAFSTSDEFLKAPLIFEPGTSWEYGIGIDWLGVLIEKISECSLQDYMKKNIFEPLEMDDTSYDLSEEEHHRVVNVYGRNGSDYQEMPFSIPKQSAFYSGGGNLISSLDNYSKFLKVFLNSGKSNGAEILSSSSTESMLSSLNREVLMTKMPSVAPMLSNDVEFFPQSSKSWSPGFMINHDDIESGRPKLSAGWAGLFNSYFWIDRQNNIAGLILMQMLPFADEGCINTLQLFETSIYS